MTTEPDRAGATASGDGTRYEVTLDRAACEGVFACLVRDERFVEAADGLAAIERDDGATTGTPSAEPDETTPAERNAPSDDTVTAAFDDDWLAEARQAAAACPVDAISVEVADE